jgi:uncharacterized small protein (DUF1192 family)
MIDTALETRCKNPNCERVVHQLPGHRYREYCDNTCKQTAYRLRNKEAHSRNVTIADDSRVVELQQRIAQLEREVETLKALRGRRSSVDAKARHNWQDRAMSWGENLGYQSLDFQVRVKAGVKEWRAFVREASDLVLIRLIMAAEKVGEPKTF